MEVIGKVVHKLAILTGSGANGEWKKQTFVIETDGQYPKKIAIDAMGKSIEYSDKLKAGQMVTVSIDISSREYQDKWYTNINAWKIVAEASAATTDPLEKSQEQLPDSGQLPF